MRALNLYAGIGGNRAHWPADAEVTAVELDPEIAAVYAELWPADNVIVADAHAYLLDHYRDGWGFIWASPPCPTHSKLMACQQARGNGRYPDMSLYQEILWLQHWAPHSTRWVVENVAPYYTPLVPPSAVLARHLFWANFTIPHREADAAAPAMLTAGIGAWERAHGLTLPAAARGLTTYKRRQLLRNCVAPALGRHIYDAATGRPADAAPQPALWSDHG